jgi:predicted peptidase
MLMTLVLAATITQGHFVERSVEVDGVERRYQVWVPTGYDSSKRWPAILFLHGAGERGTDNRKQTEIGLGPALRSGRLDPPAVIVFPQCPEEAHWIGPGRRVALAALDAVEREFSIDPRRVTLTGVSMGGTGVWVIGAENPLRFAALAPVCGRIGKGPLATDSAPWFDKASDRFDAVVSRIGNIPTWIFHGGRDDVVPPEDSRQMIARLGASAAYTEFPTANHNAWDPTYNTTGVVSWLVKQVRKR